MYLWGPPFKDALATWCLGIEGLGALALPGARLSFRMKLTPPVAPCELFEAANELGISCVTICHRPALLEHHHQMLRLTGRLAEDGLGWELLELPEVPQAWRS